MTLDGMSDSQPPSPSFDTIFQQQHFQQQHQNQRTASSSSSNHSYPSNSYHRPFVHGTPMMDEPAPIAGDSRQGSISDKRQRTTSSSSSRHPERNDSIPFQSTLLNTAQGAGPYHGGDPQQGAGYPLAQNGQQYGTNNVWSANGGFNQYGLNHQPLQPNNLPNGHSPLPAYQNYPSPAGNGFGSSPGNGQPESSEMGGGGYSYSQGGDYGQGGMDQVKREYNDDGMFGVDAFQGMSGGGQYGNGLGGGNGNIGNDDGSVNVKVEDIMEDLLQTLSRQNSREQPSPGHQNDQYFQQQQQSGHSRYPSDQSLQAHQSNHGSRPTSPFENFNAPSPSFTSASIHRPTSSPNSPFMPKPQSPPIMSFNNAPSPVSLPPIVTQQPNQPAGGTPSQGHALVGQVGGMGGLLPPTNPALHHLGMLGGISPIAPNVDGPQIFVQPSTPISGLKDGRGHFDAALRRAAQLNQQNHQNQQNIEQSQQFTVPQPNRGNSGPIPIHHSQKPGGMDLSGGQMGGQPNSAWNDLGVQSSGTRPRSKSDSYAPMAGVMGQGDFERQAMAQIMAQAQAMGLSSLQQGDVQAQAQAQGEAMRYGSADWRDNVGAWLSSMGLNGQGQAGNGMDGNQIPTTAQGQGQFHTQPPPGTLNPNQLPGNDQDEFLRQLEQQHQLAQIQSQKIRNPLSVDTGAATTTSGIFKYEPGEFSPTSMAFYQQRGMLPPTGQFGFVATAPYYSSTFPNMTPQPSQNQPQFNQNPFGQSSQQSNQNFTAMTPEMMAAAGRRLSFIEEMSGGSGSGSSHHATGAGTPGYGMGFADRPSPYGGSGMTGRVRGVSPSHSHRRGVKSEDLGRGGWGLGHGGSTTEFLNSITANDGSLIPPIRTGRTHSRHSSVSSGRSASPALSISSHGSSFSHASGSGHGHMDMPGGVDFSGGQVTGSGSGGGNKGRGKISKMKVTSEATEVAATSRRTNNGIFQCPVPDCGSTFTRHFNLKGHMRSHNDERPYKCLYDGCPKSEIGFARQHDCKRHMLLHQNLKSFRCDGCQKQFARLDALTRHHKSQQGIECATAFPLPTNPDGSPFSESQYKNYKATQGLAVPETGKKGRKRATSFGSDLGKSGDESAGGGGSGMEDYDRA